MDGGFGGGGGAGWGSGDGGVDSDARRGVAEAEVGTPGGAAEVIKLIHVEEGEDLIM